MPASFIFFGALQHCVRTAAAVLLDFVRLVLAAAQSRSALAAENLFLRKQLAFFQERKAKPRRADDATRWIMVTLSHLFSWRGALVNVKRRRLGRNVITSKELGFAQTVGYDGGASAVSK